MVLDWLNFMPPVPLLLELFSVLIIFLLLIYLRFLTILLIIKSVFILKLLLKRVDALFMTYLFTLSDGERSERTINRAALSSTAAFTFRVRDRSHCLPSFMPNRGFCFGGRPALALAAREAGLVIPAYCLTAETFPDSGAFL